MRNKAVTLLICLAFSAAAFCDDVLFINGKIFTAPGKPQAAAMLIRDARIVAVGGESEVRGKAPPAVREINLVGKRVLPGLIDTHTHALDWARTVVTEQLDLRYPNVKNIADIEQKVRDRAASTPAGSWIIGTAWDDSKLSDGRYVTAADLDAAAPNNPVMLQHVTGHLLVANSAAMKVAGVTASTPTPGGGVIERDPSGNPTGIFKDNAMGLIDRHIPPVSEEQSIKAIAYLSKVCEESGLTTIHDVALLPDAIAAYQDAEKQAVLGVRVHMAPLLTSEADANALLRAGVHTGFGDDWLKFGAIKMFADGGMAARTIAIYPPGIVGDEKNVGLLLWQPEEMQKMQLMMAQHGWQLSTHAIGDRAIDEVIDSYAKVAQALPGNDLRNRVIHDGVATPAIQKRLAEWHILVDNNPPFIYFLGKHFAKYGPFRARWSYPGKSYFDKGIVVSGGSDVYVTPIRPWWGIWSAVERIEQSSGEVLSPQERLTVEQAITMYTINGAYAGHEEKDKGTIEAGKLADFIVLDRDIFAMPSSQLKDVKVLSTWIGGVERYHYEGSN